MVAGAPGARLHELLTVERAQSERMEARWCGSWPLLARGDAARAAQLAGATATTAQHIPAPLDARLLTGRALELRRLGSRVSAESRRAARRPGALTEREQASAELVAQGYSNKQTAAALYLSEGTIENGLTRIYAKLGVRSRTQLALALSR